MVITSLENAKVKNYIKLASRKYRKKTKTFIVEGLHLVLEAYKANRLVELILEENEPLPIDMDCVRVTREIICKISSLETPSNVMGVCTIEEYDTIVGDKILILDGVQDPGNLGTIIRSAAAFDVDTIVLSPDTVDLYNPKVIRSTQGMLFYTHTIVRDLSSVIDEIKNKGILVYSTNVETGDDVSLIENKEKYAIVMGNEGNGVKKEIMEKCDKYLYVKMNNNVESLNVAVATSIILYELDK